MMPALWLARLPLESRILPHRREITNQHQDSVINQYAPYLKYVEP
jgi:hypothetical protein